MNLSTHRVEQVALYGHFRGVDYAYGKECARPHEQVAFISLVQAISEKLEQLREFGGSDLAQRILG